MKNTRHTILFSLAFLLGIAQLNAQGLVLTPLKSNDKIKDYNKAYPFNVWNSNITAIGVTDTIDLPFFEDFTGTEVYPDFSLFIDNTVYINNTFPISPPSYGVATFDNLDNQGNPYQSLNQKASSISDYLTSQPINMKDFKIGASRQDYKLSDSIFFSFFYQEGGNGDSPEKVDSLVLQFKDSSQRWNTVWATKGGLSDTFSQIIIGFDSNHYLFEGFQFRFYNYSKNTGNLNHWHIDFIRMAQGRNAKDLSINEVAINQTTNSLLRNYGNMPYDHFFANYTNELGPNINLTYRNNGTSTVNTALQYEAFNMFNKRIGFEPFSSNNRNIVRESDSTESFPMIKLDTLSGKEPSVRIKFSIQPQSNDNVAINYSSTTNNNIWEKTYKFPNYFAYDDGSPEAGMGLEYGGLPSGDGYVANKFTANKQDSIWGVHIHLTQILEDVSSIPFEIFLWQDLTSTSKTNMLDDIVIYSQEVSYLKPDTINGTYYIAFDTAQLLDPGDFYIGWKQNSKYYFNVGYDKNYKVDHPNSTSTNIYYNLLGYWREANLDGAIMMHPVVGDFADLRVGMEELEVKQAIVYPNPTRDIITIKLEEERVGKVEIYSTLGIKVLEADTAKINIQHLPQGNYYLKIWDFSGNHFYTNSLIKIN